MTRIVNPDSYLPRYIQIFNWMKEMIDRGRFPLNEKLPSESKLAQMCGVNRHTVRQALAKLVHEGYISRKVGIGTFVIWNNDRCVNYPLDNVTSLTDSIKIAGLQPSAKIISQTVIKGSNRIREQLGLLPGSKIIRTVRLRSGNGIPLIIEISHLPYEEFKEILNMKFTGSGYRLFSEQFGVHLERAYQTLSAISLPQTFAKKLRVAPGSAAIFLECIVYGGNNIPIDVLHAYFRGDRYRFHVHSGRYDVNLASPEPADS